MMKKSFIAVAVTSLLTIGAAQAETELYGSIRYNYQNKKQENTLEQNVNGTYKFTGERVSNFKDGGSRIGIKGSEDLGNSNKISYLLEWAFDGMESGNSGGGFRNRKASLTLSGNWGAVTAGRQDNPFKVAIVNDSVVDGFNGADVTSSGAIRAMTSAIDGTKVNQLTLVDANGKKVNTTSTGFDWTTINNYTVDKTPISSGSYSRLGKVISYSTPNFSGFQANAAIMMDEGLVSKTDEKHVDLWTINAKYSHDIAGGEFLIKGGYLQGKQVDKNKSKVWGILAMYNQKAFGVSAGYASGNHKEAKIINALKEKSRGWDVGARFSFGANYYSTIRATYGENELKMGNDKDKVKSWAIGFEQKLSKRTRTWIEYGELKTQFSHPDLAKKKDSVLAIGMRHDF